MTACHSWKWHYERAEDLLDQAYRSIEKRRIPSAADQLLVDVARVHALMATVRAEPSIVDRLGQVE